MKKTLAAVLAAMMALSTATVAFASDNHEAAAGLNGTHTKYDPDGSAIELRIAQDGKYDLSVGAFGGAIGGLTAEQLGWLIDENLVAINVKVTEGRSYLSALPTVKEVDGAAQLKLKFNDTYKVNAIKPGTEKDPLKASLKIDITFKKDVYYDAAQATLGGLNVDKAGEVLEGMAKGDTVHLDPISFKSGYYETDDYGLDMTFTNTEAKNRETVIIAENLLNEVDDETVTIYFDDTAAWSGKIASTQKNLNVYFVEDEIAEIVDAYGDDIDFEFLTFKGTPSFSRAGSLTFNAIGGEDTVVYEVIDDKLVVLDGEYDSTYGIVTVDNVRKLTSYVIASEAVEAEVEVEVEEPAVEEENPNTGAC